MKLFRAIGLMSGTSMDGVDAAVIETDGVRVYSTAQAITLPYSDSTRAVIAELVFNTMLQNDEQKVLEAENLITKTHIEAVDALLAKTKFRHSDIDVVGFHGHTIDHRPHLKITRQIGNGNMLAKAIGICVVNDFRTDDVLSGGQGAPLIPVYHRAIIEQGFYPACCLNIGGVANITYIDKNELIAFDTGAGNALIDDLMFEHTGKKFDADGAVAISGKVNENLLRMICDHEFFKKAPPKSLDRNDFKNKLHQILQMNEFRELKFEDIIATVSEFTVFGVMEAFKYFPKTPSVMFICGGGINNKYIYKSLGDKLNFRIMPISAAKDGLDPDFIEAQGFGFLAVRSVLGLPISYKSTTGIVEDAMTGGVFHQA